MVRIGRAEEGAEGKMDAGPETGVGLLGRGVESSPISAESLGGEERNLYPG